MTLSLGMVTIDTPNSHTLGAWWAEAFGGEITFESVPYFTAVKIPGIEIVIAFQGVPDPTPGKNRVHLDISASDRSATVAALIAKGAKHVSDQSLPSGAEWTVLEDPEGNQFCIADAEAH